MKDGDMIFAPEIVGNPKIIDKISGAYQILYDQSLGHFKFDNLNKAICIMARKGWKCITITSFNMAKGFGAANYMYALMERVES